MIYSNDRMDWVTKSTVMQKPAYAYPMSNLNTINVKAIHFLKNWCMMMTEREHLKTLVRI